MVRFAEEKDIVRVNELRKQVNDIHVNNRPDHFKEGFCKELQDYVLVLLNGENSNIIVVERDGFICGMACVEYIRKPESAYSKARDFYHVQEIAVDEAFRRKGVASELFEFMKKDAKERNLSKIELDVWRFNDSAIEFYEAVGFNETRKWMEYDIT